MSLNFHILRNQKVAVKKIQMGKFDVRKDGTIDPDHVDELVEQEVLTQNPLVTSDYVPARGRHGIPAAIRLASNGVPAEYITVDILTEINFSKLSSADLVEFRLFCIQGDLPGENGIRRYLSDDDLLFNIREMLGIGASKTVIIAALISKTRTRNRISKLIYRAEQSILQERLSAASAEAQAVVRAGRNPNLARIVAKHGLAPEYAPDLLVTPRKKDMPSKKTFRSMLAKQSQLKKAGKFLHGYMTRNLDDVRTGQMNKIVAVQLANAHIAKAEDLLLAAKEGLNRIEQIAD